MVVTTNNMIFLWSPRLNKYAHLLTTLTINSDLKDHTTNYNNSFSYTLLLTVITKLSSFSNFDLQFIISANIEPTTPISAETLGENCTD